MKVWSVIGGLIYPSLSWRGGSLTGLGVRSSYGIRLSRWWIQFSRALFLLSAGTTNQGACFISVYLNISSFAIEYSTHFSRDARSMGLSFHLFVRSSILDRNLRSCSSSDTENQYFISIIPDLISIRSYSGHERMNSLYSSSVQNPNTTIQIFYR